MSERQANVILAFVFGVIFVRALLLFVLFVPNQYFIGREDALCEFCLSSPRSGLAA
jgi:hypothetical protein